VLARSGIDLARSEWLKPLGEGLFEFRIRHDAVEIEAMFANASVSGARSRGPALLRVFCAFHGNKVVLLLGGYDKGRDDSAKRQQREIKAARKMLARWREEQRKVSAASRKGR
jgi:putative component of toxin-antitoxin plasmid stabilization module